MKRSCAARSATSQPKACAARSRERPCSSSAARWPDPWPRSRALRPVVSPTDTGRRTTGERGGPQPEQRRGARRRAMAAHAPALGWDTCDVLLHAEVTQMPEARRFRADRRSDGRTVRSLSGACYIGSRRAGRPRDRPAASPQDDRSRRRRRRCRRPWAVSLIGGHEGGANALALGVANVLGPSPSCRRRPRP